jgi:hypothetical protein
LHRSQCIDASACLCTFVSAKVCAVYRSQCIDVSACLCTYVSAEVQYVQRIGLSVSVYRRVYVLMYWLNMCIHVPKLSLIIGKECKEKQCIESSRTFYCSVKLECGVHTAADSNKLLVES